jgi:hypothetical protein
LIRFFIKNLISEFLLSEICNLDFSPDGNEKPEVKKANFSCQKRATKGSSFYDLER